MVNSQIEHGLNLKPSNVNIQLLRKDNNIWPSKKDNNRIAYHDLHKNRTNWTTQ
jgi:hypothetical protein